MHVENSLINGMQLLVDELQWSQMAEGVARVMWPTAEES